MTKDGKIYIGTSGWKYEHWNGIFYPDEIKKKDQLNFFTSKFGTVELNNSFYRQPTAANFKQWKDNVPGNFVYAVKANRFFTHLKKLKVSAEDLNQFLSSARQLGNKLGPVLFQLPPRWKINIERFREFLAILPKDMRFTVEFRDQVGIP